MVLKHFQQWTLNSLLHVISHSPWTYCKPDTLFGNRSPFSSFCGTLWLFQCNIMVQITQMQCLPWLQSHHCCISPNLRGVANYRLSYCFIQIWKRSYQHISLDCPMAPTPAAIFKSESFIHCISVKRTKVVCMVSENVSVLLSVLPVWLHSLHYY